MKEVIDMYQRKNYVFKSEKTAKKIALALMETPYEFSHYKEKIVTLFDTKAIEKLDNELKLNKINYTVVDEVI